MKFKYVNPKSVDRIIGKFAPVNSFLFSRIIEEALDNINQGYVHTEAGRGRFKSDEPEISEALIGISDRLLDHNVSHSKKSQWDLYQGLDFDIVHETGAITKKSSKSTQSYVNAYFYFTEFSRQKKDHRVVFHLRFNTYEGTEWSISFPVQLVMKGYPSIENEHIGYSHSIALCDEEGNPKNNQHHYIGITKRNWLKRMSEHFNEIRSGSNKTFHRAWREYAGRSDVLLSSELITTNHTFEQIMAWEEWAVDEQMDNGTSLNMILGGFKGMKHLHEHRLTNKPVVSLKERDAAIIKYQALHPRAGIPNLIISELWNNEEYALKVICGVEGRLSADQVRKIRELNELSIPVEKITERVKAKNVAQVERVLSGKTYSRIH
ncbi:MAG: hypothetical protein HFP81_00335 [Methylococcales symbiont of Hymedesmia sp. n. MRB-2018]|nr:MAG: hypothetical protein HFP81_00335 [Methylococcales symbiont of Hymedesmia sp. n. MRB-2018]